MIPRPPARALRLARGALRDERGTTAVEFGLLALPFFTIIAAILETALVLLASQVLDSAVGDASRLVRTGQAQTARLDLAAFRAKICDRTFGLLRCDDIQVEVKAIASFGTSSGGTAPQKCTATGCTWTPPAAFNSGKGGNIMQISAHYRWPLVLALPYFNLKNQPDSYRLISGVRVFRNEPFPTVAPSTP